MFNHIGAKIKGFAKFLFWTTVIFSIIIAMVVISLGSRVQDAPALLFIIIGIVVVIFGIAIAWLNNFLLYGFGELVDSNQKILEILERKNRETNID